MIGRPSELALMELLRKCIKKTQAAIRLVIGITACVRFSRVYQQLTECISRVYLMQADIQAAVSLRSLRI